MSDNKDSPKPVGINMPLLMYENRLYANVQDVWHLLKADGILFPASAETQEILDRGWQTALSERYWASMTVTKGV